MTVNFLVICETLSFKLYSFSCPLYACSVSSERNITCILCTKLPCKTGHLNICLKRSPIWAENQLKNSQRIGYQQPKNSQICKHRLKYSWRLRHGLKDRVLAAKFGPKISWKINLTLGCNSRLNSGWGTGSWKWTEKQLKDQSVTFSWFLVHIQLPVPHHHALAFSCFLF